MSDAKTVIENFLAAVVDLLAAQYKLGGEPRVEHARYQLGAGERVNHGDNTMVKRRKFLIGAGALATGGSAALGTGATVYNVNDRSNTMDVVADTNGGVIGFNDTSPGDIVNSNGDQLEIDFTEYTAADGVNVGSEFIIGDVDPSANEYVYSPAAFQVVNQAAGTNLSYTLSYELTGNLNQNGSQLTFYFTQREENDYGPWVIEQGAEDRTNGDGNPVFELTPSGADHGSQDNTALDNHKPGEALSVGLKVDTDNTNSSSSEDLSGNLTIEATPVSSGGYSAGSN